MPKRPYVRGVQRPKRLYGDMIEVIRQHPGQPAKVAIFKDDVRIENRRLARNESVALIHYLNTFEGEHWQVHYVRAGDTWGDYEVWVEYIGPESAWARARRGPRLQGAAFHARVYPKH